MASIFDGTAAPLLEESERRGMAPRAILVSDETTEESNVRLLFEERLPVRYAPVANYPGRRRGHLRLLRPANQNAIRQ